MSFVLRAMGAIIVHVYGRWLAITAVAYVVAHHLGLLPDGLGAAPHGTQWADWLDLVVPVVVLGPAAMTLRAAAVPPPDWWLFGIGCVVYATGHGIHLAANSVDNARPGPTAHLWDEIVGHLVWYAGAALVLLALARSMRHRPRPGPLAYVAALAVGLTWTTNAVGGHTELLSLVVALWAVAFGWAHRGELGETLLVGFVPSAVLTALALTPWV